MLIGHRYATCGNHAFVDGVLNEFSGRRVIVCGHSNTVPGMLNALVGEERYAHLSDSDYDNLYIVSVLEIGSAEVVKLQFAPEGY